LRKMVNITLLFREQPSAQMITEESETQINNYL
jgi:hypothetical protein